MSLNPSFLWPPIKLQGSPLCGHFVLAHVVVMKLELAMLYFLSCVPCRPIASHMFHKSRVMPSLSGGLVLLDTVMGTGCVIFKFHLRGGNKCLNWRS